MELGHPTLRGAFFQIIFGILLILGFGLFISFCFTQVNLETELDAFFTLGMFVMGGLLGAAAMMVGVGYLVSGVIALVCFLKKVDYL